MFDTPYLELKVYIWGYNGKGKGRNTRSENMQRFSVCSVLYI